MKQDVMDDVQLPDNALNSWNLSIRQRINDKLSLCADPVSLNVELSDRLIPKCGRLFRGWRGHGGQRKETREKLIDSNEIELSEILIKMGYQITESYYIVFVSYDDFCFAQLRSEPTGYRAGIGQDVPKSESVRR